jgi:dihydrofolate reductase
LLSDKPLSCRISLIAAMDRNRVIGRDNEIPWRLPAEMKWFRSATMGKPILMGRKTYESIGRPLPGRHNIVLTRNEDFVAEGCTVVHSIGEAKTAVDEEQELMVIGGAYLYEQMLPLADCLYLTYIEAAIGGDTYFPEFTLKEWETVQETFFTADERNPYNYRIVIMQRLRRD